MILKCLVWGASCKTIQTTKRYSLRLKDSIYFIILFMRIDYWKKYIIHHINKTMVGNLTKDEDNFSKYIPCVTDHENKKNLLYNSAVPHEYFLIRFAAHETRIVGH